MGVQRGVDRSNDWLWRPLKRGAGRGAGGVSAGRGGGVEVGGSGAMTRELGGRKERGLGLTGVVGGCSGTRECGGAGVRGHAVMRRRAVVGPGYGGWPVRGAGPR